MTMWPSSPAAPVAPRTMRPSARIPPPTPVPIVSMSDVARAARGAVAPLGDQRRGGVVVDDDRQPEALRQQVAQRHVDEREVVARHRRRRSPARRGTGRRRRPRGTSAAGRLARLLDGLDDRLDDGVADATGGRRGGAHAAARRRSRRGASCLPGRRRSHRRRPSPCHHTPLMPEPTDTAAPPEYKLYRARPRLLQRGARRRRRCSTNCAARRPARRRSGASGSPSGASSNGSRSRSSAGSCCRSCCSSISATLQQDAVPDSAQAPLDRRRRRPDEPADDARARLRPAHARHAGARRDRLRPEPVGQHPAPALRRRPQLEAVDPARHGRRHPRPRPRQDQRRLRDRRPRAHDPDDRAVPRASTSTTSSSSTSRTSPSLIDAMGGIDYTGGCVVSRINGGFKNGGYTLRLQTRHDAHRRQAGARARPHAQERCATRARTTAPAPGASRRSSRR